MAGIFRSTDILAGLQNRRGGGAKAVVDSSKLIHLDGPAGATPSVQFATTDPKKGASAAADAKRAAELREQFANVRSEILELRDLPPGTDKRARIQAKIAEGRRLLAMINYLDGPAPMTAAEAATGAMGVRDDSRPADTRICIHGDTDNLGSQVPRGFVSVVSFTSEPAIDHAHSGRLELARWLSSRDNPLTARVAVNRIWEHLFGDGLVRTVDNFGSTGEKPSHPELLDYLAQEFLQHNESVKTMIRTLVLSHAYQLASSSDATDFAIDPADRLQWRMSPRRLDAEEIRDAMLQSSGQLDRRRPVGSSVMQLGQTEIRGGLAGNLSSSDLHRSIYLPIMRDLVPPVLEAFDFAEPTLVTGQRDVTTVATQSLFLMNDPFVVEQSRQMARQLLGSSERDDAGRVTTAYRLALGRAPTAAERTRAIRYVNETARAGGSRTLAAGRDGAWASFCQALMAGAEFRYLQ
jgi:hypothetical protein